MIHYTFDKLDHWRRCKNCQVLYFAGGDKPCAAGGVHAPERGAYYLHFPSDSVSANKTAGDPIENFPFFWCAQCNALYHIQSHDSGVCPAGGGHTFTFMLGFPIPAGTLSTPTPPGMEGGWRLCSSCSAAYSEASGGGRCAAGGPHNPAGFFIYFNTPGQIVTKEEGWRRCRKCRGLVFAGDGISASCPAGDSHDVSDSENYFMGPPPFDAGRDWWRRCNKCRAMISNFVGTPGSCPAGDHHDYELTTYYAFGEHEANPGEPSWFQCGACSILFCDGPENQTVCIANPGSPHVASGPELVLQIAPDLETRIHAGGVRLVVDSATNTVRARSGSTGGAWLFQRAGDNYLLKSVAEGLYITNVHGPGVIDPLFLTNDPAGAARFRIIPGASPSGAPSYQLQEVGSGKYLGKVPQSYVTDQVRLIQNGATAWWDLPVQGFYLEVDVSALRDPRLYLAGGPGFGQLLPPGNYWIEVAGFGDIMLRNFPGSSDPVEALFTPSGLALNGDSSNPWIYSGGDTLRITVQADGSFTTNGDPQITGKLNRPGLIPRRSVDEGTFDTQERLASSAPRSVDERKIIFSSPWPSPPVIAVGLNAIGLGAATNTRIKAAAKNITTLGFTPSIESWSDTRLDRGRCAWLEMSSTNIDVQSGTFFTPDQPQLTNSRRIHFGTWFAATPVVVVWLNQLDFGIHRYLLVSTYATDVDRSGFTIHIDSGPNAVLNSAGATWIAYRADLPNIVSGVVNAGQSIQGTTPFPGGRFSVPPRVCLGLSAIDVDQLAGLEIAATVTEVSTLAMTWAFESRAGDLIRSATAAYLAIGE